MAFHVYNPPECHLLHKEAKRICDNYSDVMKGVMASQITSLTIVYLTAYPDADQRKHQSSASLAFVRGIHQWPGYPAHMASNAQNVSIWWRHQVMKELTGDLSRFKIQTLFIPWIYRYS